MIIRGEATLTSQSVTLLIARRTELPTLERERKRQREKIPTLRGAQRGAQRGG